MAERRMFSKSIVNSARFLRMPQSARLLYYDLGMAADDDGVAEAFTVMQTTGASENDLQTLASKGLIQVLNQDLVSYITDWNVNNQLRRDRYRPSIYAKLLESKGIASGVLSLCNQSAPRGEIGQDGSNQKPQVPKTPQILPGIINL